MRVLIAVLALATLASAVEPAAAQDLLALTLARDADHFAAEQAARQRDITLTNDIARLDAQMQTNQALAGLAAQQARSVSPPVPRDPNAPPPVIDVSKLASIPDAELAASNARVRAAAQNRR